MSFSTSSSGSSAINDDFILMRNLRGYESKWFLDLVNDVDGSVISVAKFHKIAKKKEGGQWKAFIILKLLLYFLL